MFGQSECTGPHTVSSPGNWKIGSCGRPMRGTVTKIVASNGELCYKGTYTVLHCTILYCTVLYCTVLSCTVPYCTVLYCTVLYYSILYLYCNLHLFSPLLITLTGRHVFMGYMYMPDKSAETIDEDGTVTLVLPASLPSSFSPTMPPSSLPHSL